MSTGKWKAILLIVAFLAMGFYQERIKVGINFLIEHSILVPNYNDLSSSDRESAIQEIRSAQNVAYDYYYSHSSVSWLYSFGSGGLKLLKWLVTGLSIVLHFFACYFILFWWFGDVLSFKQLASLFGAVIFLAGGVLIAGKTIGYGSQAYAFARELLGSVQSLVPLMILAPAIWLKDRLKPEGTP
jgi:hypothetical protein